MKLLRLESRLNIHSLEVCYHIDNTTHSTIAILKKSALSQLWEIAPLQKTESKQELNEVSVVNCVRELTDVDTNVDQLESKHGIVCTDMLVLALVKVHGNDNINM